ncbi:MAG: MASE1 domain-containing protein [Stenotrophomonas sp.]|uniref:MASE1 domain-containing protein n=1 Tax=Stenotrophomonas sp. TaxID=69392 RepID=UPI003D6D2CCA
MQLEWWKKGARLELRIRPEGIAFAVVYALACWATRKVSLDQFYLPAGMRVAALLLCPPRFWFYLILGEYAYFAHMRYPMIEKYGLAWVIVGSGCLMPSVALVVRLHARLLPARIDVWLLSVGVILAVMVTMLNTVIAHLLWPVPVPIPLVQNLTRFALGDYLGILTIAPLALLWFLRNSGQEWNRAWLRPTVASLLVMLALGLTAAALPSQWSAGKTSLQLTMALPVIALTCMHGWRGAAIGVPLLNLIIGLTTPAPTRLSFDHGTFVTQQIMAVAGTALLALGSRISHHYHQYRTGDLDRRMAIEQVKMASEHVRTSHMASEMDLRERALSMRRLGEGIDHSLSEIAYFLKQHGNHSLATDLLRISVANSRQFRGQTSMVYPTALEHVGLYLALQISGINEEWSETNRVATLRSDGDPCQLSVGLQLAAYRTLVEAVSLLLKHEPGQVGIRARCGRVKGYQGIFASVQLIDKGHPVSPPTAAMAIERLTGRTLAYSGTVQCRRNRIRIVLIEAPVASKAALSSQTLA